MSRLKRDIPVPNATPEAYKMLLKRERMQKPASVKYRKEILMVRQQRVKSLIIKAI